MESEQNAVATTPLGAVYRDILDWSSSLPVWQHELLRRLLKADNLADDEIAELAHAAIADSEKQGCSFRALSVDDLPSVVRDEEHRVLVAIRGLRNVNALRADQELTFGDRLTIVYGDNASGKSGYARVLKRVYRARIVDEILQDARSESAAVDAATATFKVRTPTNEVVALQWVDGTAIHQHGRFAVLDSACARTYLLGGELSMGPAGIDIPERFAADLDRIKRRVQSLAAAVEPNKRKLQRLENDTSSGLFVKALSSTTSDDSIARAASFTEADGIELLHVQATLAAAKAQTPSARRADLGARRRALKSLAERIAEWKLALSDGQIEELRAAIRSLADAESASAAVKRLGDPDAPAELLGSQTWIDMISAAARYTQSLNRADAAGLTVDGRCSLCWQVTADAAQDRLQRFAQYLHGEAEKSRQSATRRRDELLSAIRATPRTARPEDEALAPPGASELRDALHQLVASLLGRQAVIERSPLPALSALPPIEDHASDVVAKLAKTVDAELAQVPTTDEGGAKQIADLEERLLRLATQKAVADSVDDVREFVRHAREFQRFTTAASKLNTRDASKKSGELHRKHLTDTYATLVNKELTELHFRRRKPILSQTPRKGKVEVTPLVSPTLKNLSPERVFSEGERTAIALASFMAELQLSDDPSGLIFDDPITSLDHQVREHVARRLVAAAARRQVIVFTHDLAFFADLRKQAEIQGVDCQCRTLTSTDYDAGFVEGEEPFGARGVKKRIAHLKTLVVDVERAAKQGDLSTLRNKSREFYDGLRTTWERFIEEKVLAKVVQRLERHVMPGALTKVVYNEELVAKVQEGYRRCSEVIKAHDHAPSAGEQSYSLEDMKADLQMLLDADKMVSQLAKP